MSRFPFKEVVNKVIKKYDPARSPNTIEVMIRRYNRMEEDFNRLLAEGKVSTTNPKYMTPDDIEQFFLEMMKKPSKDKKGMISIESVKKDLIDLDKLCKFEENNCVEVFKAKCPVLTKNNKRGRLPVFNKDEISILSEAANLVYPDRPDLLRSYAMLALYFGGGLRTVELRNAEADKITITDEGATIHLDIVKGIDSYGEPRDAVILPMFIPVLKRYLEWRENYLKDSGRSCKYVFFGLRSFDMLADNTIRKHRLLASEDCGVKYDGRKCRRSYGQYLKDHRLEIESVSRLMGHCSTKTTEEYYARIPQDMAVQNAFNILN